MTILSRALSDGVPLHPRDIPVHPVLQEFAACRADAAVRIEQAFLRLDERLRLTKRRYIKVGKHVTQMLLRHGSAGGPDRHADDAGRLAHPGALAVRAR